MKAAAHLARFDAAAFQAADALQAAERANTRLRANIRVY